MSSPSPGSRPTKVRWLVVVLLMGLAFLAHFNRLGIAVAANAHFIGEGKLSEPQMGLVFSAFLLVYTIGMLPGGYLIDRVGPRWAMTAMGLGFGFWSALTGVLGWTGLAVSAMFVPLLVIRGLAGAASVPLHPGAARSVSLWLPLRERSSANGMVTAGALVGIALSYPLFGALMDALGWPGAFVAAGAALMLFAVLWGAVAADTPESHRWSNPAERELVSADGGTPARNRVTLREAAALFRNRSLLLLTLSYGALGYMQYMFFYWVEYYFGKVLSLPPSESRDAAFTVTMAMAVGMFAGGWVAALLSRTLGHAAGYRLVGVGGMGLCAAFSAAGVSAGDPATVVWYFSLAMGSLGLCEGIFWTTAPALEPRSGGLAAAVVNTGGNGVGLLAPVFTPLIGQAYGWNAAVVVACVVCGLGGLLWLGIQPGVPKGGAELVEEPEVW
jgi:MFS family permease